MRIIAVGAPRVEPPPSVRNDEPEDLSGDDITEEIPPEVQARGDEPEVLSEDDVAPDSGREDAISIPPEEVELPEEGKAKADAKDKDAKPVKLKGDTPWSAAHTDVLKTASGGDVPVAFISE